ncbi:MAG: hypothetical protein JKY23_05155 [Nitrospinaceae bacterium]|nr:hypothetical protein [Nitrospinaceae bacterium]
MQNNPNQFQPGRMCAALTACLLFMGAAAIYTGKISPTFFSPTLIAGETRTQRIEKQFSPRDGSHRNVEKSIIKAMHDPNSYKHDETSYTDKKDHLIIITSYREKNSFGTTIKNRVKAKVDLDGRIIEITNY